LPDAQQLAAAVPHYRQAVQLSPNSAIYLNDLAWLLATHPDADIRNGPEAVTLAEKAVELTHGTQAAFLGTLAAAYAEVGRFPEAIAAAEKALDRARAAGQSQVAEANTQFTSSFTVPTSRTGNNPESGFPGVKPRGRTAMRAASRRRSRLHVD
jgi:tetratricopeptide (TPR) repeat protein